MFSSLIRILVLVFSIIWLLIHSCYLLVRSIFNVAGALIIRSKGNKEIRRLKEDIELKQTQKAHLISSVEQNKELN